MASLEHVLWQLRVLHDVTVVGRFVPFHGTLLQLMVAELGGSQGLVKPGPGNYEVFLVFRD